MTTAMETTTNQPALAGERRPIVATTSPLPYLDADLLRQLHHTLTAGSLAPVAVTLDVHQIAPHVGVDRVTIRLRDLHLIHHIDASRFGDHHGCPICAEEVA